MKLLSLFSGIGAFERGFEMAGLNVELVNYCEFDKYASKSYAAIHNISEEYNLGDITKVDERQLEDFDLMTYGFPCQDISVAGKQAGISEGTRSGLLYEALRIARHKKPKVMIAENVKALVSKKFKSDFEKLLNELEEMGYNNYWRVLNAKDYGIPQNRERVFVISIRKDIDNKTFEWPEPYDNGLRLKDFLEDEVEEKYYISNEKTEKLLQNLKGKEIKPGGIKVSRQGEVYEGNTDTSSTLLARDYKGLGNQQMTAVAEAKRLGGIFDKENSKHQAGSVWDKEQLCPTLDTAQGGYRQPIIMEEPKILRPERTDYGKEIRKQYEKGEIKESRHNMTELTPRNDGVTNTLTTVQKDNLVLEPSNELKLFTNLKGGKWDKIHESARRVYDEEGIAPTIPTCGGGNIEPKVAVKEATKCNQAVIEPIIFDPYNKQFTKDQDAITTLRTNYSNGNAQIINDYRIRKLTPKECWRLMGFADEEFQKAQDAGISNTQLYKQAGNSIVTNVIAEIATKLKEAINGELSNIQTATQKV